MTSSRPSRSGRPAGSYRRNDASEDGAACRCQKHSHIFTMQTCLNVFRHVEHRRTVCGGLSHIALRRRHVLYFVARISEHFRSSAYRELPWSTFLDTRIALQVAWCVKPRTLASLVADHARFLAPTAPKAHTVDRARQSPEPSTRSSIRPVASHVVGMVGTIVAASTRPFQDTACRWIRLHPARLRKRSVMPSQCPAPPSKSPSGRLSMCVGLVGPTQGREHAERDLPVPSKVSQPSVLE